MIRNKSVNKPGDGRIQYIKRGGGFFRLPNLIIKPGQIFWAHPSEISEAFKDTIIPLNAEELKKEQDAYAKKLSVPPSRNVEVKNKHQEIVRRIRKPAPPKQEDIAGVKPTYSVVPRSEGGIWYDVVDANGKKLNEKALKKEQAEEYLKSLEA